LAISGNQWRPGLFEICYVSACNGDSDHEMQEVAVRLQDGLDDQSIVRPLNLEIE
jgi:hypothetical protein